MRKLYTLGFILFCLMSIGYAGSRINAQEAAQSSLPQPPVMTNEKFLTLIGQGQAQLSLMGEYVRSLEATVGKLDTENKQLKDLKTPPPCETKKGN